MQDCGILVVRGGPASSGDNNRRLSRRFWWYTSVTQLLSGQSLNGKISQLKRSFIMIGGVRTTGMMLRSASQVFVARLLIDLRLL